MLGAVQLGVLAACIVVLVPMGLAGWHLSRNKMLFFSGALFISLAVAVHLSPYFPSLSDFMPVPSSSSSSVAVVENREYCLSLLHRIEWDSKNDNNNSSQFTWRWMRFDDKVEACDFRLVGKSDARDLLDGSWIVVAGDSQARLFVLSLLNLMLGEEEIESIRGDLFKRHTNYQILVDEVGMKLDFIWAPYVNNLTDLIMDMNKNNSRPDVLVMGSGLWHMLHFTNSSDFSDSLRLLGRSLTSLLVPLGAGVSIRSQPHLFWLGMPMLINSMLNTEEKREKMTVVTQVAYERSIHSSKLLRQSDGPFLLLDVRSLSENCGLNCTDDGMHYHAAVYEAAVQIMLNALLIQSHQKL